jgi:hypothetical protein
MFRPGVGIPLRCALLLVALLALGAAGCGTQTVTPENSRAPIWRYSTVVVGDITPGHPEWKRLARFFKAGLAQRLRESGAFESVLYPAPVTVPPLAIVVEGEIDGVDEGSELTRILIASDASRAAVQGRFRVVDGAGADAVLVEFRQERISEDSDFVEGQIYMEDLVAQFGRDAAGVVIRWSRGEDLEPDPPIVEWWNETLAIFD